MEGYRGLALAAGDRDPVKAGLAEERQEDRLDQVVLGHLDRGRRRAGRDGLSWSRTNDRTLAGIFPAHIFPALPLPLDFVLFMFYNNSFGRAGENPSPPATIGQGSNIGVRNCPG
jgi:hypothetical protein